MDWDDEPLVNANRFEEAENMPAPAPRRRHYDFSLFDLNRLVLILIEAAALTGIILGDIWLWGRA